MDQGKISSNFMTSHNNTKNMITWRHDNLQLFERMCLLDILPNMEGNSFYHKLTTSQPTKRTTKGYILLTKLYYILARTYVRATLLVLLKTMSVRVSSIQVVQIKVENKSKSVQKSRYVWNVSEVSPQITLINLLKFDNVCMP